MLPPLVNRPLLNVTAGTNTVEIVIIALTATPATWYDGNFLTVTWHVKELVGSGPLATPITLADRSQPSNAIYYWLHKGKPESSEQ